MHMCPSQVPCRGVCIREQEEMAMQQHGWHAKECIKACHVREHDLVMGYNCAGGFMSMCRKRVQHTNG